MNHWEDRSYRMQSYPTRPAHDNFIVLPHSAITPNKYEIKLRPIPARFDIMASTCVDMNFNKLNESYISNLSADISPAICLIEPTSHCNLSCVTCPNSKLTEKSFMRWDLFVKVVNQLKDNAKFIKLNYLGEPLMHPHIVDMVKYCKENTSAKISLSTNGVLLDKLLARKLIDAEVDEIIISLDAATSDTYRKIKRQDHFNLVAGNIDNLLNLNNNNTQVIIKLIRTIYNKHEINDFNLKWNNRNCRTQISWLNTWASQLDIGNLSDTFCPHVGMSRVPCAELWYKMVIDAFGKVHSCCHDFNGKNNIGDANDSKIKDIWNCEEILRYRQSHIESRFSCPGLCSRCQEWSDRNDILKYLTGSNFPTGKP